MRPGWRAFARRRAATPWSLLVAAAVVAASWAAGLDPWHTAQAAAVVVGAAVVVDVLRLGIADVAPPWVHRDVLPSAAGSRSDLVRLAVRVTADVEGRPGDASPEVLALVRSLAVARLTRAGVAPQGAADVLGPRAARVLGEDGPQRVRLRDLRAALDRLAALDDHPPARTAEAPATAGAPSAGPHATPPAAHPPAPTTRRTS